MTSQSSLLRRSYRILGLIAVLVALWYFLDFAWHNAKSIPMIQLNSSTALGLGFGLLGNLAVVLLSAVNWQILLRAVGEPSRMRVSIAVFAIAQFGKYIPGNVAQHLGRVALAAREGYSPSRVVATLVFEIAWSILASLFVAASALSLGGRFGLAGGEVGPLPAVLAGLAVAALLLPLAAIALLHRLPARLQARLPWLGDIKTPRATSLFTCFMIGSVSMGIMGAIVVMLGITVFGNAGRESLVVVGIFSLAWVAGFVAPGAPAGLGVRDAILVAGLTPIYGPGISLGLTVLARLVTAAGDASAFGLGLILRPRAPARPMAGDARGGSSHRGAIRKGPL